MIGRTYYERGHPVALIRRSDGTCVVRPGRGLRRVENYLEIVERGDG